MSLDPIDHRILDELQRDGRLSNVDLAARVGLTPSPCLRRVKRLEELGYITGYQAVLDRRRVGLGLSVFVRVRVDTHSDANAILLQEAIAGMPEVVSSYIVSGTADYLLEVVVPDLERYEQFLMGKLLQLPAVKEVNSNFAIRTVKAAAPLPLDQLAAGSH